MSNSFKQRAIRSIKDGAKDTLKISIWLAKLMVGVSFAVFLLKYFNILPYIVHLIDPVFQHLGLPGDAALAYLTGYFVNIYSALAVVASLDLTYKSATILAVMILCSHSMLIETPVLKKTGASAVRMVIIRTLSAFLLAWVLNIIMPDDPSKVIASQTVAQQSALPFLTQLGDWAVSAVKLVIKVFLLVFGLNILQRLLKEFGVADRISNIFKPLLVVSGLPPKCSILWLFANLAGLAYGAAAILDEVNSGKITKREILLVDTHIAISHSNFEDLLLLATFGASWWILLVSRWIMSTLLVWEYRLEFFIKDRFFSKNN